jgi:hypothetical protein
VFAGVNDDAGLEAGAELGAQQLEAADVGVGHARSRLRLDCCDVARRRFEHDIDLALLRVAVEEQLHGGGAPRGLLDELHDHEGLEQHARETPLIGRGVARRVGADQRCRHPAIRSAGRPKRVA